MVPGLLLAGVLGVLTMTSEYTSGTIRATLAAAPAAPAGAGRQGGGVRRRDAGRRGGRGVHRLLRRRRPRCGHGIAAPALGQPGVLRAVVLSGAGFCLIGLLGLGLGAIIRHTAAAVAVLVGGVYVVAQFIGVIAHGAGGVHADPDRRELAEHDQAGDLRHGRASCPHFLSPWAGLGVLGLYAAIALAVGGWLLARRDA